MTNVITVRPARQTQNSDHNHRQLQWVSNLPSALAIAAGITLLAASAVTNSIYGWGKSDFLPQQITWAAVSVSASVVLALSPTAILNAVRHRALVPALIAIAAMALTGAYSFTAAIGASAGQRMAAQNESVVKAGERERLQRDYNNASTELAALAPARPSAELRPLAAGMQNANPSARCDLRPGEADYGPVSRKVCPQVLALEAEIARSERRYELQSAMARASEALSVIGAAKVANSDATALAGFLAMAGLTVSIDTLNRILALLPVLLIELGPGLALALAQMLKAEQVPVMSMRHDDGLRAMAGAAPEQVEHGAAEEAAAPVDFIGLARRAEASEGGTRTVPRLMVADDLPCRMVELVQAHGAELLGSNRTFAKALGCSHTQAARVLDELAQAGRVMLTKGKSGTVVRLAAA